MNGHIIVVIAIDNAITNGPDKWNRRKQRDKKRKKYHSYYSHKNWGEAKDYHLSLDTGLIGIDGCLDAALAYIKHVK